MSIQPSDSILIIDFGSQVTQLIARRVREAGVYSEIVPFNSAEEAFHRMKPKGIILSGGPASVTTEGSPRAPQVVFDSGLPILAICYGQQTLCTQLGGTVEGGHAAEFGRADVEILKASPLFEGFWEVGGKYPVWMSHGDRVTRIPEGFEIVARTETVPIIAMADESRRWYGVQFHPEVTHTRSGNDMLRRFVVEICGCRTLWTAANIIDDQIARVRAQVWIRGPMITSTSAPTSKTGTTCWNTFSGRCSSSQDPSTAPSTDPGICQRSRCHCPRSSRR